MDHDLIFFEDFAPVTLFMRSQTNTVPYILYYTFQLGEEQT